jgi:surface polysaccharide O-acyltransferase-like enzyme
MFLGYIHSFRGIAIFIIIAFHCIPMFDWKEYTVLKNFLLDIFSNGTTYFIFIAGFLFQHLLQKYDFKSYMIKKFKNILLPYLFLSIPAIIYKIYLKGAQVAVPNFDVEQLSLLYKIGWFYLTGQSMIAFWFIPMIFIFYLVSPLLKLIDNNSKLYYFLPILFIFSSLIHRPENNLNPLHSFLYFLPTYLFGMWASKNKEPLLQFVDKFSCLLLPLWILFFTANFFYSENHGNIHSQGIMPSGNISIDIGLFHKLLACLLLINYLKKFDKVFTKFGLYANLSFGLFFLHGYFMTVFNKTFKYFGILQEAVIIGYITSFALVTASSILFLYTAKYLLGSKSKYFTGY